jgi:hypothetical protein
MKYFQSYTPAADAAIFSAWDSELCKPENSWLREILSQRRDEVLERFVAQYKAISAMPRSARRALQRRLAHARDLTGISLEYRRKLAYSLAGAALLVAVGQTVGEAGTIKVGKKCSLANAIITANTGTPYGGCKGGTYYADTIVLPKNTNLVISASYPLPPVFTDITIQGTAKKPKKGMPVIRGSGGTISGSGYALFLVAGGNLTINKVTLIGSYDSGDGAVINNNGGTVAIFDSVITGSSAQNGGAIFNAGSLNITRTDVTNNTAGLYGGGIYNAGELTVTDSNVSGNTSVYSGGGIYNSGTATITNSTITGNTAAKYGGGLANSSAVANATAGSVSIVNSMITYNTAYKGGALHNGQYLSVTSSTITNSTANYGGGLFTGDASNTTLAGTTLSGNTAGLTSVPYYGGKGGGILNLGGLTINSSVISGNTAQGKSYTPSGGTAQQYGGQGGGIYNGGYVYFDGSSSVTSNTAAYFGGGLFNYVATGTYYPRPPTAITGNTAPTGPDIFPVP